MTDADRTGDGVRLVYNDEDVVISAKTGFEAQVDPDKWQRINNNTRLRGESQRGIPRVPDPAKYPLSCRVVDLTDHCGAIMYGRTSGKRPLYVCGRYMRTSGAECENNSVDADALLRLSLATLRQMINMPGSRDRLRELLTEKARQGDNQQEIDAAMQMEKLLIARHNALAEDLATVKRRMALEKDDSRYAAIAEEFDRLKVEFNEVDRQIQQGQSIPSPADTVDAEIDAAMCLFDNFTRIVTDEAARAEIQPMLEKIGFRIGLTFGCRREGQKAFCPEAARRDDRIPRFRPASSDTWARQRRRR